MRRAKCDGCLRVRERATCALWIPEGFHADVESQVEGATSAVASGGNRSQHMQAGAVRWPRLVSAASSVQRGRRRTMQSVQRICRCSEGSGSGSGSPRGWSCWPWRRETPVSEGRVLSGFSARGRRLRAPGLAEQLAGPATAAQGRGQPSHLHV